MAALVVNPAMVRRPVLPQASRRTAAAIAPDGAGEAARLAQPIEVQRTTAANREPEPDGSHERQARTSRDFKASVPPSFLDPARIAAIAEQDRLAALAASCLQGNRQAWEQLVRSQQRRVYGLCFRFTGSAIEAEDLTQDVFLKLYRNLASFDASKASFGVWLAAMTRNLLVDNYRRSRLERASESLDEPFPADEDGPTRAERLPDKGLGQERHVAGLELQAKVQAALSRLSPELREAVILRDLEDLYYREIAEILYIPQGTVKSRISRGRAELAKLLKDLEGQVM